MTRVEQALAAFEVVVVAPFMLLVWLPACVRAWRDHLRFLRDQ